MRAFSHPIASRGRRRFASSAISGLDAIALLPGTSLSFEDSDNRISRLISSVSSALLDVPSSAAQAGVRGVNLGHILHRYGGSTAGCRRAGRIGEFALQVSYAGSGIFTRRESTAGTERRGR